MAELIDANPLPTVLRSIQQFEIPKTLELMDEVKRRLDQSPGVAVVDSLPLEDISIEQAIDIFWTIGQRIGTKCRSKVGRDHGLSRS